LRTARVRERGRSSQTVHLRTEILRKQYAWFNAHERHLRNGTEPAADVFIALSAKSADMLRRRNRCDIACSTLMAAALIKVTAQRSITANMLPVLVLPEGSDDGYLAHIERIACAPPARSVLYQNSPFQQVVDVATSRVLRALG
jgi:hypothetical protein